VADTRVLRGIVRTSLTAGVVLSVIATGTVAVAFAAGLVPHSVIGAGQVIAIAARGFGLGAVAGGLFAAFVARHERHHTLASLSAPRVALWAGLATATVPLLALLTANVSVPLGMLGAAAAAYGVGGSVVSAGMLRLARRAPLGLELPGMRGRGESELPPMAQVAR